MATDARRERAWARLSAPEKVRARRLLPFVVARPEVPPFAASASAYEKVLHALVAAGVPLSPAEIAYLLIAAWGFNTDIASVRRRVALAVQQGEARSAGGDRFQTTPAALDHLRASEQRWLGATPARSGELRDRPPPRELRRRDDPAR